MKEQKDQAVSALHEILKWSLDRPDWQRDALHRIIQKETLLEKDVDELEQLCRVKHGLQEPGSVDVPCRPLDATHLPPSPGLEQSTTLVSIGNLKGVNRLASGQTISFGPAPGLTIVYGDNATGKSGYARVLKKACRARGAVPVILPNIFEPRPSSPASADIHYRIAETDTPTAWEDGKPSDPSLANVFVFDAMSADHYLQQDDSTSFTPYGLEVLPKLSKICDEIRQRIDREKKTVNAEVDSVKTTWKYKQSTTVGKLIDGLSANTDLTTVETLSQLDPVSVARLKDLNETLKSDPKQKAKETRASSNRIKAFALKVGDMATSLSETQIAKLFQLVEDARKTAETAKAFASRRFDGSYLPGTGDELWKVLVAAARDFSTSSAYKGKEFPVTEKEALCVLCQQQLEPQAVERFKAFKEFLKDKSQELAKTAEKLLKTTIEDVDRLNPLAPELSKIEADLAGASPEQLAENLEFVKTADSRLAQVKKNFATRTWTEPPPLSLSPANWLNSLAESLEARVKTEESAEDPAVRRKLEFERDDLVDREWLASAKDAVLSQIERHKRILLLEAASKDTLTSLITNQNVELTKKLVTKAFCERFSLETGLLGLRTLKVEIREIKGRKGETKFGLRLSDRPDSSPYEIASEGERRCVTLAACLAELSQASHRSTLVFDDPASSLDHHYRDKIAKRLVEESEGRQVIVFTHDVVFLNDLLGHASDVDIEPEVLSLEWNGDTPGYCMKGLPWDWESPNIQLDKLDQEQALIANSWSSAPNDANIQSIRAAYSKLRSALERLIEREIFADVVYRFRRQIKTPNLAEVVGFPDRECVEIQRLLQRCHDVTDAHSASLAHSVPEPADLAKDITDAKTLLSQVRARKKAARLARAQNPVTPSVANTHTPSASP